MPVLGGGSLVRCQLFSVVGFSLFGYSSSGEGFSGFHKKVFLFRFGVFFSERIFSIGGREFITDPQSLFGWL